MHHRATPRLLPLTTAVAASLLAPLVSAQSTPTSVLPSVTVIGNAERLPSIAGAGQVIEAAELEGGRVFTVNEALRKVPGVHARDEEGFGLRPNIGIRGLNPTRSTKVTLLEDGLPLAYAPYGDNASYYHPQIDRFRRIEVLKGASSLLFGPQTVGGVINYVSPEPPEAFGGFVQLAGGNRDYFNGHANVGGAGWLLDYVRKEGDGARDNMGHEIDDLNLKAAFDLAPGHGLIVRANHYQEDSTITYTGLTQAEFDQLGARYNPFKNDKFNTHRTGVSATHEWDFAPRSSLVTSVYYAKFDRDWWRQSSNSTDAQCGAGFVNARLAGTVVDPSSCNSVQGRLRTYYNYGIEPRLTYAHSLGELQAGFKLHHEEQDRQQINGASPTARSGTTAEDNLRKTDAQSVYLANRFDIGNVTVMPIVRHERIKSDRTNRLTGATVSNRVSKTMPGLGITWNPTRDLTAFASVHKGFAPPRTEDLLSNTGTVTEVDAEESTNFELGFRAKVVPGVNVQAAYFRNRFQNLIAVGSIAGGSTPLSQGKALFEGVELGAQAKADNGLLGRLAYTWLPTARQSTAFRNVANQALVGVAGNRQPYAPKNTLTAAAGWTRGGLHFEVEAQYVGKQFSDFANTVAPTADGQRGVINDYTVLNASLNYRVNTAISVFLTGKNLSDRTYIVDRTRGIQVGQPLLVQAGMKYAF